MDEVLRGLIDSRQCSEVYEIVKVVEIVVSGESYRIEVYRNFSLPRTRILFEANCYTRMVVDKTPGEFEYTWLRKSVQLPSYPDAEGAVRGTVDELERITKALALGKSSGA